MRLVLVASAILGAAATAGAAAPDNEDNEDFALPEAFLVHPASGATGVPSNASILAARVTELVVVSDTDEEIATTREDDPASFTHRFLPVREIPAGFHSVHAIPDPDTWNYEGADVRVMLGNFESTGSPDEVAPVIQVTAATWWIDEECATCGSIDVVVGAPPGPAAALRLELDIGDDAVPLDAAPDLAGPWSLFLGIGAEDVRALGLGVEAEGALVRARATDAAGNTGDWSLTVPFQNERRFSGSPGPAGCSQLRGSPASPGAATLWPLLALLLRRRSG